MGDEVMTQAEAWNAYDQWKQDERIVFLDEPPNVESTFRGLSRRSLPSSKNWADAYLAAFAEVSGMYFVTFDRGFHGKIEKVVTLNS